MKKLHTLVTLLLISVTFGQNNNLYTTLTTQADSLYQIKAYQKSANTYKAAFDIDNSKAAPWHRYLAARSHALAKNKEMAFYHLFRVTKDSKFSSYDFIKSDPDFNTLQSDKRWNELLVIVKANKDDNEKDFDKSLVTQLATIEQEDQKYRNQLDEIEKTYGVQSDEVKAQWALIEKVDAINLLKVKAIIDERGWLGPNIIGQAGSTTLFLVIQHADQETQEQYLPIMKQAVIDGKAQAHSLALLEDRVLLGQGKQQIYGSQILIDPETNTYYLGDLIDPEHVDIRRKEVGLSSISDYLSHFDMTWDIDAHKKKIAELKKKKEQ